MRFLRARAGLTQEALSETSGIHTTEISRLENGHRNPTWETLKALSGGLGVPTWHLAELIELLEAGRRLSDLPWHPPG